MVSAIKEPNLKFYLVLITLKFNLNSLMCLVATILSSAAVDALIRPPGARSSASGSPLATSLGFPLSLRGHASSPRCSRPLHIYEILLSSTTLWYPRFWPRDRLQRGNSGTFFFHSLLGRGGQVLLSSLCGCNFPYKMLHPSPPCAHIHSFPFPTPSVGWGAETETRLTVREGQGHHTNIPKHCPSEDCCINLS